EINIVFTWYEPNTITFFKTCLIITIKDADFQVHPCKDFVGFLANLYSPYLFTFIKNHVPSPHYKPLSLIPLERFSHLSVPIRSQVLYRFNCESQRHSSALLVLSSATGYGHRQVTVMSI